MGVLDEPELAQPDMQRRPGLPTLVETRPLKTFRIECWSFSIAAKVPK